MCLIAVVGTDGTKASRMIRGKNSAHYIARFLLTHIFFTTSESIDSAGGRHSLRDMIILTPRAARQVQAMHAAQGDVRKKLRVLVEGGGCSGFQYGMSFDLPKAEDQTFASEGVEVLVDAASLAYLNGTSIDFDDGLQGKGFEIRNPNAQSTCGCGKSFN